MKGLLITAILFLFSVFCFGQVKHTVQPKETLYGLSKQYNVSQQDIIKANPFIADKGLQIGDVITIPNTANAKEETVNPPKNSGKNTSDSNYIYVEVQPKETLYNLSKTYDISIDALKSLNPSLTDGLKVGDVIRIPKKEKPNPDGYHKVQSGQTLYTISKIYNVSIEEILLVNRDLQIDNLQIDQYVKIPNKGDVSNTEKPIEENETVVVVEEGNGNNENSTPSNTNIKNGQFQYEIKQGETVFSILNKFDISLDEFVKANPTVKGGLNAGEKVNIPLKSEEKFTASNNRLKDDTIRVSLFLPFYLEDDTKRGQKEISTLFLSGAKLALDSLTKQGKRIKAQVFDSGDESSFQKSINANILYNSNVLIGPFSTNNIIALRESTKNTDIPIVSPLLKSESLKNQKNIIFSEVDDYTLADKIIEEVNDVYTSEDIYILTDTKATKVANYLKGKLNKDGANNIVVLTSIDELEQKQNVMTEEYQAIIPILVSENEDLSQQFIDKIESMDSNSVKPFSVYYLNSFDKPANIAKLRKSGFVFVAERKVNTKGINERKTLNSYNKEYCQSPPKYAVMGFDVVYDLLSRMDDNKELLKNMDEESTRLATRFDYSKLPSGSYENKGVRVIRYNKY